MPFQTGTFEFKLIVKDQNTATPTFDSSSYNVEVYESFPVGFTIPDLTISASGKYFESPCETALGDGLFQPGTREPKGWGGGSFPLTLEHWVLAAPPFFFCTGEPKTLETLAIQDVS